MENEKNKFEVGRMVEELNLVQRNEGLPVAATYSGKLNNTFSFRSKDFLNRLQIAI